MTSPLPPKRRDTRNLADLLRQDRQNLRQLGTGFASGRNPLARPMRPQTDSDYEDDDDGTAVLFENTDTGTVSSNGSAVTIALSHEPIDGSEQVFYRGMGLKRSDWYRTESLLTIPGERWFKAGDKVWVDYAYEDVEVDGPQALSSFTLRGWTQGSASTSLALPAGTQVGDTIVLIVINQRGWSATISDPRLHFVDSRPDVFWGAPTSAEVWIGTASDLSAVASSAGSTIPQITALTFAEPMTVTTQAETMDTVSSFPLPTVSSGSALLVLVQNNNTVAGPAPSTSAAGYSLAAAVTGSGSSMWAVYDYLGDPPTPSGSTNATTGDVGNGSWALVMGMVTPS